MREVTGGSIATVPVPLAPIVAQRFALSVAVATFLSFPFAFALALPTLASGSVLLPVPFRGIIMNLSPCKMDLPRDGL